MKAALVLSLDNCCNQPCSTSYMFLVFQIMYNVLGIYMITAWTLIDNYTVIIIMAHFWVQCMKLLPWSD